VSDQFRVCPRAYIQANDNTLRVPMKVIFKM